MYKSPSSFTRFAKANLINHKILCTGNNIIPQRYINGLEK